MRGTSYVVLVCCFVGSFISTTSGRTLRTVALTAQQAPETSSGLHFSEFDPFPVLNSAGQVAFLSTITGGDVESLNDRGIWSDGGGSLALVARTGDQAPGTPPEIKFSSLGSPHLNSAGHTAFYGNLVGGNVGTTNYGGIWSESNGPLSLVARGGEPAPGVDDGATFFKFGLNLFNDAGQIAFQGAQTGGDVDFPNDRGVWLEESGTLALVAHSGEQVPGAPIGTNSGVNRLGVARGISLNIAGHVAFHAFLTGLGVNGMNNEAIWSDAGGTPGFVVRKGDRAPGTSEGVTYSGFGRDFVALNSAGQRAFRGFLTGPNVDLSNQEGIWSEGSGLLELIARRGTQVPGVQEGVTFRRFEEPILNSAGHVAFRSNLASERLDDRGLFSNRDGMLRLIARTGDSAPGTPSGVNFAVPDRPVMNSAGQVAFFGLLTGTGIDATNSAGIWAEDRSGSLQLVARTGDLMEVAPGQFSTIDSLTFRRGSGNGDGRPSGFNDLGQLAFRVIFTDGSSGIFVSSRVAVPEPESIALVGTGLFLLTVLRRVPLLACPAGHP